MKHSWVTAFLLMVASGCSDGASDDEVSEEVFDVVADGDALADGVSDVASDSEGPEVVEPCVFDAMRDHFLLKNPDARSNSVIWIAFLSSGYATGINFEGPGATDVCFELPWRIEACDAGSATIVLDDCDWREPGSMTLEITDAGLSTGSTAGLPSFDINGIVFERWTPTKPSNLDAGCVEYDCELFPVIE